MGFELRGTFGIIILMTALVIVPVSAATTQVHIVRYANDNITVLNETTVNYTWMVFLMIGRGE